MYESTNIFERNTSNAKECCSLSTETHSTKIFGTSSTQEHSSKKMHFYNLTYMKHLKRIRREVYS